MTRFSRVSGLCLALLLLMGGDGRSQDVVGVPVREGWAEKTFDFSFSGLDFVAQLPKGTQVATVAMKARRPDSIGSLVVIGKVQPNEEDTVPIEVSIVGYDLRTAASADRLCERAQEEESYQPFSEDISPDHSEAFRSGLRFQDNRPVGGMLSRCMTRGRQALGVHFLYDLAKAENGKQRQAITKAAEEYAMTFLHSMTFTNGRNDGYWDGVVPLALTIDGKVFNVRIPDNWQVPINDFDGRATAELHILRQDGDVAKGAVWFTAADMKDRPDLEKLGRETIPLLVKAQSQAFGLPRLTETGAGPDFSGDGSLVQNFLFSIAAKDGADQGVVRAMMLWHAGRLYLVANWSPHAQDGSQNAFFSNLPGTMIFDGFVSMLEQVIPKRM